jgi:hypothetical protein
LGERPSPLTGALRDEWAPIPGAKGEGKLDQALVWLQRWQLVGGDDAERVQRMRNSSVSITEEDERWLWSLVSGQIEKGKG